MERAPKPPDRRDRRQEQIQSEMEELFRMLVNRQRTLHHQTAGGWRPHLEVYESEDALVVRAELAGVDERSLDVTVEDQVLQLRGVRRRTPAEERRVFHQMEISYGPFAAEVYIPCPIEAGRVEANYEGGILQVTLPKVRPRRIVPNAHRAAGPAGDDVPDRVEE